ncbi:unnamed protein product [Closterium sp. Yama58-4]|nr:unnamed protein product [Closterium sp. Yama58-4]
MKFGKEFASYQVCLQESTDLPARFPQVDYRALKKILRRCISSHALRAELHAQAELHAEEEELRAEEAEPHAAEAELHTDGAAEAARVEADAWRGAADAASGAFRAGAAATAALGVAGQEVAGLKHSAENCAFSSCARGEVSAPAAPLAFLPAAVAEEYAPAAVADASASGCARCDAEFFGLLEAELISIERSFNSAATRLLSCHNARGLQLIVSVSSPRLGASAEGGVPGESGRHLPRVPGGPIRPSLPRLHAHLLSRSSCAGLLPVFFGLDSASPHITCPLCCQQGVFRQPRTLKELHRLIMARQPEEWKARRDEEQKRRLEEERRYWDGQMRIAMHIRR